jgi:hypothetical protein
MENVTITVPVEVAQYWLGAIDGEIEFSLEENWIIGASEQEGKQAAERRADQYRAAKQELERALGVYDWR